MYDIYFFFLLGKMNVWSLLFRFWTKVKLCCQEFGEVGQVTTGDKEGADSRSGDWRLAHSECVVTQTSGDGGDGEPHPVTGHPAHDGLASASQLFTTNPGSHFHKQKSLTLGSSIHFALHWHSI